MILYPQYRLETYWNIVVILFTSYIAIWIPLHIIFPKELIPSSVFLIINVLSYVVFLLDIIFTIKSTSRSDVHSALRGRFNLRNYLSSWFMLDVIVLVPFSWLLGIPEWDILRLAKLVIIVKITYEAYQLEVRYPYLYIFGFFTYIVGISAHGLSCGWIALTEADIQQDDDVISIYIQALYWAVTTLTTVGYGDIVPKGNAQIIYYDVRSDFGSRFIYLCDWEYCWNLI